MPEHIYGVFYPVVTSDILRLVVRLKVEVCGKGRVFASVQFMVL